MTRNNCVFCSIVAGQIEAARVYEDDHSLVFLDSSPVFPGHCLVCPKQHVETLPALPAELLQPLFSTAQLICRAVESGLGADGSFVAINNKISQSVPHLHVHVMPRRKGDGMKGFFWPRRPYRNSDHTTETQKALQAAVRSLLSHA